MSCFAGAWWPEDEMLEALDQLASGDDVEMVAARFLVTPAQVVAMRDGVLEGEGAEPEPGEHMDVVQKGVIAGDATWP